MAIGALHSTPNFFNQLEKILLEQLDSFLQGGGKVDHQLVKQAVFAASPADDGFGSLFDY